MAGPYIRNADGRAELYDIVNDPPELRDLAGSTETEVLLRLGQTVQSLVEETRSNDKVRGGSPP